MVVWTEYLRYRAQTRGFDLNIVEQIVRFSEERYLDTVTQRRVAVGRHGNLLVVIPYEEDDTNLTPITIHTTTRQQINFRQRTGRFIP
jgi:hypothetical protein